MSGETWRKIQSYRAPQAAEPVLSMPSQAQIIEYQNREEEGKALVLLREMLVDINNNEPQIKAASYSEIREIDAPRGLELIWGNKLRPTEKEMRILNEYKIRPGQLQRLLGDFPSIPEKILRWDYFKIFLNYYNRRLDYNIHDFYVLFTSGRRPDGYNGELGVNAKKLLENPDILIPYLSEQLHNPEHIIAYAYKGTDYWCSPLKRSDDDHSPPDDPGPG